MYLLVIVELEALRSTQGGRRSFLQMAKDAKSNSHPYDDENHIDCGEMARAQSELRPQKYEECAQCISRSPEEAINSRLCLVLLFPARGKEERVTCGVLN